MTTYAPGFLPLLTGSFSSPAHDNPTVEIMEAAYRAAGVHARYLNCEVPSERLPDAVRGAVAQGWRGYNCSLPHKVTVIGLLDGLTEAARLIGAVNCVRIEDGELVGDNTDGRGFVTSLREVVQTPGLRVLVLGAGGAARAIAVELALAGAASVDIACRRPEQGRPVAESIRQAAPSVVASVANWQGDISVTGDVDIVVNATSVGLGDPNARLAFNVGSLDAEMVVADVIPNPASTRFLREAAEVGCRTVDGRGMLVNQAAIAVRWWLGIEADTAVMRARLDEVI